MTNDNLFILYGSRTGNSKAIAQLAHDYAQHLGIKSECLNMQTLDTKRLNDMQNLLVAVSTHGEGDPPAPVEDFYRYIHSDDAPAMNHTNFALVALGDSSYKHFCKTGKDIEKRLIDLGASEMTDLVECDIDFEEKAKQWVKDVVGRIAAEQSIQPLAQNKSDFVFELKLDDQDKYNAFNATILEKQLLSTKDSSKRTYHLSLSLKNSGIAFKPGDSFGVYCTNSKLYVDRIIRKLNFDPTFPIRAKNGKRLLKEALVREYELTIITPVVVKKYADIVQNKKLNDLVTDKPRLDEYVQTRDILDLITDFPARITPEQFLSILRKLAPRLYSVASSDKLTTDTVDLTVGIIEYDAYDRFHIGVGSSFFAGRIEQGEKIPVFLEPNEKFRLPENSDTPVIMIATGTGIAPFRAFLQDREESKVKGHNWLFFGDRKSDSDFLYKGDLQKFLNNGTLSRLDAAFSRDTDQKVYITNKMQDASSEIYRWINIGAHIYVCGNKRTMAKSVRKTLKQIISNEGRMSGEQASALFEEMKVNRQYQEDVY
ncbi:MAG: flavodoxin domain-containing protein [Bacteroidales bacterium]|nr:flavodoxin domain-containing protein [Bacteroidales bacterium]